MESHKTIILKILKSGKKMTSMDGYMLGIVQTTNRINELITDGHDIQDKWMTSKRGKRYKVYFMPVFFDVSKLQKQ